ncbi:MAG: YqjD family protein [Alphaproteobacteria bacterium]
MSSTAKIKSDIEETPSLEAIAEDIASLKRDLSALMEHVKQAATAGAGAKVKDAADHLGHEARQVFGNLSEHGEQSVKAVERQIEERPFTSLLVAFAIGYLGGRLTRH